PGHSGAVLHCCQRRVTLVRCCTAASAGSLCVAFLPARVTLVRCCTAASAGSLWCGVALLPAPGHSGTHENFLIEALIVTLFVAWCIVSNVVMINLLIALMGNTFNKVEENAERAWRLQWARIILQIERRLPSSYQQRFRLGEVIEGKHWHVFEEVSKDSDAHQAQSQLELLGSLENSYDSKDRRPRLKKFMHIASLPRNFSMASAIDD
ncbi:hypothetical protein CYMTET_36202, partial [Cymbomonas tetramitiformis]